MKLDRITEKQLSKLLLNNGSAKALPIRVSWLIQQVGSSAKKGNFVNIARISDYLRAKTGSNKRGIANIARMFDKVVPKNARGKAKNVSERKREAYESAVNIDEELNRKRTFVDEARRDAAERSLTAWIRTYCVGVLLNDAPPKPHGEKILREMEEAVGSSRPYQILVARGGGKTSYTECFAAYAIATGRRKFCLISSINAKQAQQILREMTAVFTSEPFATDYPDIAVPIQLLDGHGRRSQRQGGHDTKVRIVTDETLLPTITLDDGSPSRASGACIRAKALKSVRGTKNGTQRPDLVILDDLQTREIAENEERVADVLSLIRGDVMALAGKGKAAIISTATTIAADDLTEQLAADPVWKTTKNPAILTWPKEWAKDGHGLWGQYFAQFDEENAHDQKHARRGGSLTFYRTNRAAMDAGADILNWDNFDRESGQISGLQKLLDAYHQMGHAAFMAEYQMEPVKDQFTFEITPRVILSRVRPGVGMGGELNGCVFTAAATDINPSYALTTNIVRFDIERTALVVNYFVQSIRIDSTVNDTAYNQKIFSALAAHGRAIKDLGITIDAWGIDAGGKQYEAVPRFAEQSGDVCGIVALPMVGKAGKTWNPNVKTRIAPSRNETVLCRDVRGRCWLAWNADTYKEQMQRAWMTETGSPGGCSIFDGGIDHTQFAIQISNERLVAKQRLLDGRIEYLWKTKNPHDFGDTMAMCYALAGARGYSASLSMPDVSIPGAKVVASASGGGVVATEKDDFDIEIGCDF